MAREPRTITVFGSGHPCNGDSDYEEARLLGGELARRGYRVCTGGYNGVMEAALRGAREAGGRTLGVTVKAFRGKANAWADEERSMESWQERLFELIRVGEGYVVCKGGTGTLAELAVVWEMLNKGMMASRPLVALGDFWAPVARCVVQAELEYSAPRSEAAGSLIHFARDAREAAELLARRLDASTPGGTSAASL